MVKAKKYSEIITRSHQRCILYGIEKNRIMPVKIYRGNEFEQLLKKNHELINVARPFIEILYDFLKGSGFSLYLTDGSGIVLTIIGDEDIIKGQAETGIMLGSDMSEKSTGTNAIGTALYEKTSVQTSGEEHYINAYHIWTCSAAVIHNEYGDIIGCLNLTGRRQLVHQHTLGLVVAAVKSIENQLKVEKTQNELFKAYQYLNKVMDSINSGIFAVDTNGAIKAINNSACIMIDTREEDIINKNINNVLDNWPDIYEELKNGNSYENKEVICGGDNSSERYSLSVYPIKNKYEKITGMVGIFRDMQNVYNLVNKYSGKSATYTFKDIVGRSKEIMEVRAQAKSISNSPSTVLIQGESGTGKELIAQSIHNESNRHNNSFVAINCGAIPKGLIESELFGYEEGAFTGARRGGHPGKFELASGGTLFLDEVGEMPLDMQVNLLRVLQEGCVTRVGGNKQIEVDVRIIAATNKNLKLEVDKGTFREDLYYRLSVIPIYVPPLRQRQGDAEILIKYFLKVKSIKLGKPIPKIRYDVWEKLLNYNWPGNVREMENCIENIVNMNGDTSYSFENNAAEKSIAQVGSLFADGMCSLEELEEKAIFECIDRCCGNITKASAILGINRSTLYAKVKKYNEKCSF